MRKPRQKIPYMAGGGDREVDNHTVRGARTSGATQGPPHSSIDQSHRVGARRDRPYVKGKLARRQLSVSAAS